MATKVKARPKRKPVRPKPRAISAESALIQQRLPQPVAARRRKLVQWRTGETFADQDGNPVTWDENDPAAEAALMAKAKASGGGWALVPSGYRFLDLGAAGKVWR